MKRLWRNPVLVLGAALFIIGIPGIIDDVDTWAEWLGWLPEGWWVVPLGVGLGISLFEGIFRLGKLEGRSEAELEALQSERSAPESEAESAQRLEPAPEPGFAPPSEPTARVYTPRSLHELTALAEGKTQLAAERETQPHLEKWISASGVLKQLKQGFSYHDEPEKYSAMIDCSAEIDGDRRYLAVHLEFDDTWKDRLEMFSLEDRITAHGKIKDISALGISLEECELDDI